MTSALKAWSILQGGIEALDTPSPEPELPRISVLVAGRDESVVRRAAFEARGVVIGEGRAPNITQLFAVCLRRAS